MDYDPDNPSQSWPLQQQFYPTTCNYDTPKENIRSFENIHELGLEYDLESKAISESIRSSRNRGSKTRQSFPENTKSYKTLPCQFKGTVQQDAIPACVRLSKNHESCMETMRRRLLVLEHKCKTHVVERSRMSALERVFLAHLDATRALFIQQEELLAARGPRVAILDTSSERAEILNTQDLASRLQLRVNKMPKSRQDLPPLFSHEHGSQVASALSQNLLRELDCKLFTYAHRNLEVAAASLAAREEALKEELMKFAKFHEEKQDFQNKIAKREEERQTIETRIEEIQEISAQRLATFEKELEDLQLWKYNHALEINKMKVQFERYQMSLAASLGNVANVIRKKMGFIPDPIQKEFQHMLDLTQEDIFVNYLELNEILPADNFS